MNAFPQQPLQHGCRVAAAATGLVGVLVLLGSGLAGLDRLKSLVPGLVTMKAGTALALALAGAALWIVAGVPVPPGRRRLAFVAAAGVGLLGLLGEDPLTATAFLATGAALVLLARGGAAAVAQGLALVPLAAGALSVVAYAYSVSAMTLLVLGLGLLLARPRQGLMAVLTADTAGGTTARQLLPAALVTPFALGWLRREGERFGLYGTEFGLALLILLTTGILTAFVWWNAARQWQTEKARLEAELARREAEAGFRHLFERSPVPMWVYDVATLYFLEVNQAAVVQYGYTRNEFLRMRITDIRGPEDGARLRAVVATFTEGEVRRAGVWKHRLKDGRIRAVDVVAHSIEFGGRRAALVAGIDVTELHAARAALERSMDQLHLLHQIDQAMLAEHTPEKIAGAVLESLRDLLGVPRAIVNLFDLAAGQVEWLAAVGRRRIWQGPEIRYSLALAGDLSALRRGEPQVIDVRALPPGPEVDDLMRSGVRTYVVVPMIAAGGELIGSVSLGSDQAAFTAEQVGIAQQVAAQLAIAISQARLTAATEASESRFRALVEGSIQGVYIAGEDLRIRYANAAAAQIYGAESAEALVGRSPLDFYGPEERQRLEGYARARLRGEPAPDRYEALAHRLDGTPIWLELLVSVVATDGKRHLQTTLIDISERRAAEERLRRSEEQLRQAQKMEAVGRLAGGVAHDFNNLLTVIGGHGHLLVDRLPKGDPSRRDAELILRAAERAAALTNQLLAFSRRQVLQPRVLDLAAVVDGIAGILRRMLGEDIEVRTAFPRGLGHVRADVTQIEQVLFNLGVNARDAMPAGGQLTIEAANVDLDEGAPPLDVEAAPGRYVMLTVGDTVTGMDAETQARIFEPFFTTKEPGKGTGLGLATVYGAVKQSGGHIRVESAVGRGTTFTIYLPRVDLETDPAGAPRPEAAPRGAGTILLVEDDAGVRALAKEMVEVAGYTVLDAASPQAALDLAGTAGPIDLLLTDVVMPGMNGRALAEQLTRRRPGLRVLFMSGYSADVISRQGLVDPTVTLVQKPFTPVALLRAVHAALQAAPTPSGSSG